MSWPPPWAGDTKAKRQLARSAGGATGGDNVHLGPRTLWVTTPRGFILGGGWRETASPPSLPDWNRQPPQSRVVGIWSFHTVGGAAMRQRTFQASAVAFTSDCSSPLSGPCSTRMASDIHQLPGGRGRNGWSSSWPWWNDAVAGPGGPGRDGRAGRRRDAVPTADGFRTGGHVGAPPDVQVPGWPYRSPWLPSSLANASQTWAWVAFTSARRRCFSMSRLERPSAALMSAERLSDSLSAP